MKDVGRSLTWEALHSFISNLEIDSAIGREINPELYRWSSTLKTNAILADIYDVLAMINSNLVALGQHKRANTPKPYPRLDDRNNGNHYGNSAVPVPELRKLFAEKRRKRKDNV